MKESKAKVKVRARLGKGIGALIKEGQGIKREAESRAEQQIAYFTGKSGGRAGMSPATQQLIQEQAKKAGMPIPIFGGKGQLVGYDDRESRTKHMGALGEPMERLTTADMMEELASLCISCRKLCESKNQDYAGVDAWGNLGKFGAVGIAVRLGDKMGRLETLAKRAFGSGGGGGAAVGSETLEDTIKDIHNYSLLLLLRLKLYGFDNGK